MPKRLDIVIDFNTNVIYSLDDYKEDILKNFHSVKDTEGFNTYLDDNYDASYLFYINESERDKIMQEYLKSDYLYNLEDNTLDGIAVIKDCLINLKGE